MSRRSKVCVTQFGFCTVATSLKDLRRLLLLDNQSTCDIFCNKALVTKVWRSKSSITVQGNVGSITTNFKAFVKNYGEVWFDTRAITSILSLKNVKNKYRVTYDSETEDVFTVHMNKGRKMQFKMHEDGLHYHDTADRQVTLIQTVQQNKAGYSQRQLATAHTARDL